MGISSEVKPRRGYVGCSGFQRMKPERMDTQADDNKRPPPAPPYDRSNRRRRNGDETMPDAQPPSDFPSDPPQPPPSPWNPPRPSAMLRGPVASSPLDGLSDLSFGGQPPAPPPGGSGTQYGGASSSHGNANPPQVNSPWVDPDENCPTIRKMLGHFG